jgi:hypothetical protein
MHIKFCVSLYKQQKLPDHQQYLSLRLKPGANKPIHSFIHTNTINKSLPYVKYNVKLFTILGFLFSNILLLPLAKH